MPTFTANSQITPFALAGNADMERFGLPTFDVTVQGILLKVSIVACYALHQPCLIPLLVTAVINCQAGPYRLTFQCLQLVNARSSQ